MQVVIIEPLHARLLFGISDASIRSYRFVLSDKLPKIHVDHQGSFGGDTNAESENTMHIDIRQKAARRDFNTQALRDLIERQLGFALGRFGSRISRVCLFFEDLNGPRGGMDLECRAIAKIRGTCDVVVELRDCRMEALINRVAERLGRLVTRRFDQQMHRQTKVAFKKAARILHDSPLG